MTDARALKIGDVVPLPGPIDMGALRAARVRRGQLARADSSDATNFQVNRARLILDGMREREERFADPVEQAKAHLRRRGLNVYCGTVAGHPEGTFVVGTKLRSTASMMALAVRLGWNGKVMDGPMSAVSIVGRAKALYPRTAANDSDSLLSEIQRFLQATGMAQTRFCRAAGLERHFVNRLEEGRRPRPITVRRALDFIAARSAR